MMDESTIKKIKDQADCRALFRRFWSNQYREQGNCACPFHEDSTPSLQVDKDRAYCHAEGKGWDALDLFQAGTGTTKAEAIGQLCEELGIERSNGNGVGKRPSFSVEALDYLKARGIVSSVDRLIAAGARSLEADPGKGWQASISVPLTDWNGKRLGNQILPLDGGEKKFKTGTPAREVFFRLAGTGPVIVTEGIYDALSVAEAIPGADVCAILSAGFTGKLSALHGREVVLFLDGDDAGRKGTAKAMESLQGTCRAVDWGLAPAGMKDSNDLLKSGRADVIRKMVKSAAPIENAVTTSSIKIPATFTAAELMDMEFPEPLWLVPGILPEGISLLVGRPKMGKSFLILETCIAMSCGGCALGREDLRVPKRGVLYISLEDIPRRLKKRIASLSHDEGRIKDFHLAEKWSKLDKGGLEALEAWLDLHPDVKVVVVDTWQRIKGQTNAKSNAYENDVDLMTPMKVMVDRRGISLVLIHHARKMGGDDPLDEVSGSTGLTGSVDTILLLRRDARGNPTLYVRGRDVEEDEWCLQREGHGGWTLKGKAEEWLPEDQQEIIDLLIKAEGKPLTAKEIREATGQTKSACSHMTKKLLQKGKILSPSLGVFVLSEGTQPAQPTQRVQPTQPAQPFNDEVLSGVELGGTQPKNGQQQGFEGGVERLSALSGYEQNDDDIHPAKCLDCLHRKECQRPELPKFGMIQRHDCPDFKLSLCRENQTQPPPPRRQFDDILNLNTAAIQRAGCAD